jgi:Putative peptidoglycan binding domain
MTTLYPWGYAKALVSIEALKKNARIDLMEPEYGRRLFAWIESRKGMIGIGGAWRAVQPVKPGFAPPGKSFHETQLFGDKTRWFMAVDLVHRNGTSVHRSPTWDEVPKQGSAHPDIKAYGVHCNVNGEPWHMQVIEVDGHATWVTKGCPRPKPGFPIAGVKPPAPTPVPPKPPANVIEPGTRVLRLATPTMTGTDVVWVQNVLSKEGLKVSIDGLYGRQTRDRVKTCQGWNGLTQDGIVGPQTWKVLKAY